MTGMKEGAGKDPFAKNSGSTETEEDSVAKTEEETTTSRDTASQTDTQQQGPRSVQIPYKFRRDGVQDGRNRVPLFLQSDTKNAERDAFRELEDRFGDDVSLTDLREALVKVGLQHLDEVEAHLEGWGYGMTFDD